MRKEKKTRNLQLNLVNRTETFNTVTYEKGEKNTKSPIK